MTLDELDEKEDDIDEEEERLFEEYRYIELGACSTNPLFCSCFKV